MDKIWYKSYDPGVPHTINPDQFASLAHVLEDSFSRYPDKPCFINFGVPLTYGQLDKYSQAFAGYLQTKFELKKGDRILMMMPSILQYPVAVFGAIRAGLTVVNANPLSTYKELNALLKITEAKCVVVFENFAYLLEPAIMNTQVKHVIYTKLGDLFPFIKGAIINFVVKNIKKMVPSWHIPGAIHFNQCVELKYQNLYKKVFIDLEDIAFIQLSGGRTTGWENPVMLTHRNMIANMLQVAFWLESFFRHQYTGGLVNPFPFSRTLCMTISFVMMKVGFKTILVTNPRDIKSFVKELKMTPFSMIIGINSIFNALMQSEDFQLLDFSNLKFTFSGGMALQYSVAEKWKAMTGSEIIQGYGMTETSPMISVVPFSSKKYTTKVGLPLPSTEVKICDENGTEQGIDVVGELWVKGPQVFKGYFNDREKTKQVLTDNGWIKTGDMASIDSNGYIQIIDRKEDMILISGKRVFATEVEEVISEISGVYECAVIAHTTEENEKIIKAVVIRLDPTLEAEDILKYCQTKLKDYQVPKMIVFSAALPKSIAGYVLRRVLREESVQVKLKSE